ncbi:hypothetical protein [Microvirga massiliensis]|uniref:hypothetical protein n=1 Tax=Microvirga massiliensis TaxID=1033741 RepID=UPI00062BC948|nr:hypothetical protein [Microvirga massiliensis]
MSLPRSTATAHSSGVLLLEGEPGLPCIALATGEDCLRRIIVLGLGPGAYLIEVKPPGKPPRVYAGGSGRGVSQGLRGFRQALAITVPSRIIAITAAGPALSEAQAAALEQMLWMQVEGTGIADCANHDDAFGRSLGHEGYARLRTFAATAFAWLSPHVPYLAPGLLAPLYLQEACTTFAPGEPVEHWRVRRGPVTATVLVGASDWVVQPDSLVRRHVPKSTSDTTRVMREELVAWGVLVPTTDARLWRLTHPVGCQGRTAVHRLVFGVNAGATWMRLDGGAEAAGPGASILLFPPRGRGPAGP